MKAILLLILAAVSWQPAEAQSCGRTRQQLICPGDPVVSGNTAGQVLGVNPYQQTVAFKSNAGYNYTVSKEDISLGIGCLNGACIGDRIVYGNTVGTIIGVNPYRNQLAMRSKGGYIYTVELRNAAIGLGCVVGICVGDRIISGNTEATVLAVNRYTNTVAFQSRAGYVYNADATSLASAEYCDTYGQWHRQVAYYPVISDSNYKYQDFRFSVNRPRYQ